MSSKQTLKETKADTCSNRGEYLLLCFRLKANYDDLMDGLKNNNVEVTEKDTKAYSLVIEKVITLSVNQRGI